MPGDRSPLTERQKVVASMLARRMTIKEIAAELQISDSGVNKHIAALERRFEVNALSEVVAAWRASSEEPAEGLSKPTCIIPHLAESSIQTASHGQEEAGDFELADSGAPLDWPGLRQPQVLPRWLEGRNPVIRRLAAVFGIMIASLAVIILTITVLKSMSEMVTGTEPDLVLRDASAD